MANIRDEGVPLNAISLSDAFRKFTEYRFRTFRDLEHEAAESCRSVGTHELDPETGKWRRVDLPQTRALNALKEHDSALLQAELSFRKWLDADGPAAFNLDPITREWRRISRRWTRDLPRTLTVQKDSSIVSTLLGNFLSGFEEDFVRPNDMFSHGPSDAQFDGVLLRVFFDKDEFELKLAELDGPGMGASKAPAPGRPTIMGEIELELDRWIEGGHSTIRTRLKQERKSKAAIARALRAWALASGKFSDTEIPRADSIENALRQKLTAAYEKI
jgi:hypothetical protein